jgi:hypothetical protein
MAAHLAGPAENTGHACQPPNGDSVITAADRLAGWLATARSTQRRHSHPDFCEVQAIEMAEAAWRCGIHTVRGYSHCRGEAIFHTICLIFARERKADDPGARGGDVLSCLKCYVARMRDLNLEELRRGGTLESSQAGAPFDAFNRSSYLRHAQITTLWERVLAVISVGLIGFTLFNILVRALWP